MTTLVGDLAAAGGGVSVSNHLHSPDCSQPPPIAEVKALPGWTEAGGAEVQAYVVHIYNSSYTAANIANIGSSR